MYIAYIIKLSINKDLKLKEKEKISSNVRSYIQYPSYISRGEV